MLVAATAVALPATAEAATVSGLTKSVQGTGSPTDHGATANWVIGYDDQATGTGAATITDAVGAGQAFQSGSLHAPPGWTPSWSTDGSTFTGTEPASGVTAVRATDPDAGPDATSVSGALTPPVQAVTTATGGDGFTPILHRTPSGALQAWNIYHHLGATSPKVVCTDLATGQRCPGGPWPKVLNTAPGPLGTLGAGDIASTMVEQYVHDPATPARVYYPAVTASSVGVGCLDLAAAANCGYWALSPTGGSPAVNSIGGFVESGGNLYGTVSSGAVVCWTIASRSACGGQPYAPIVPAATQPYVYGALTVVAGKVFASTSSPGTAQQPSLGCFDPATATACAGWAAPRPTGPAGNYSYNDYTAFDPSGAPVGACATTTGGPDVTTCYALDGSALAAPPGPAALPAGVYAFPPEVVTDPVGHVRTYLPIWNGGYAGAALCHDWTTGAACAGLPGPITHPSVNGGATRDYGYTYDPPSGCLIGLGDAGVLFSMDPATGATPCVRSGGQVTLRPADFSCDGGSSHVQGYTAARLSGVDPANVDFAASRVTVVDQAGATVPTPGFAPDGSVDLTGVSVAGHPSITVTTTLLLHNGTGFSGSLVVGYAGDAPQVCFRTTISADCAVASVADTATGTDSTGAFTSNTVTLPVAPGASCTPKVKVEKEICTSTSAAKCGPGGAGPWAKQTGVGLLGLLNATAYWRITVTDLGPVGITSAQVVDTVEPSCRTGPFSLAAGQSEQVYCSTYALLSLFPITNQAKASYVPANAPAGTPPSHTGWSSATACSLLCVL
ncbi:hypothetical protein GCM10027258_89270 [Amycolatopsis stemonae]